MDKVPIDGALIQYGGAGDQTSIAIFQEWASKDGNRNPGFDGALFNPALEAI